MDAVIRLQKSSNMVNMDRLYFRYCNIVQGRANLKNVRRDKPGERELPPGPCQY